MQFETCYSAVLPLYFKVKWISWLGRNFYAPAIGNFFKNLDGVPIFFLLSPCPAIDKIDKEIPMTTY